MPHSICNTMTLLKNKTSLKKLASYKRSSLFSPAEREDEKKFHNVDPRALTMTPGENNPKDIETLRDVMLGKSILYTNSLSVCPSSLSVCPYVCLSVCRCDGTCSHETCSRDTCSRDTCSHSSNKWHMFAVHTCPHSIKPYTKWHLPALYNFPASI